MIHNGDCLGILKGMDAESVHCCVTSPPYWGLRDYGVPGQLGLEPTPEEYVSRMVDVFREVRRVLRGDGTLWLNLGDSYAAGKMGQDSFGDGSSGLNNGRIGGGSKTGNRMETKQRKPPAGLKPKDLVGIPWRVAFALQADGWYLRQDIIWAKPNPMPESATDRCTKAHEYLFLLAKSQRYYYDHEAVKEPASESGQARARYPRTGHAKDVYGDGIVNLRNPRTDEASRQREMESGTRNRRSVWTVSTKPYKGAHFATFPPKLIEPCILAGCPEGGTVLDPFAGSGTTGEVALKHGRRFLGIELNPEYVKLAEQRIAAATEGTRLFADAV